MTENAVISFKIMTYSQYRASVYLVKWQIGCNFVEKLE